MSDTEYILVAQYFHPDTASTGQLMTDLATGLQQRGLDMTVYTTQPNYHSGDIRGQPSQERHEGVLVKRIRAPQLRQTSLPRRAFNWLVYTAWMGLTLLCSRANGDREIVFVSNPPFFGIAMWLVCRIRGWKYTYIVYDLWPEKGVEFGFYREGGVVDRLWSALHYRVFRDAADVVTLGSKMREGIVAYDPESLDGKVSVIHNWADADFITPMEKSDNRFSQEHGIVNEFTLLYSGNIGLFHDLETVVRAVSRIDGDGDDVRFLIIGEGDNKESVVALAEDLGVLDGAVEFLPFQPREELPFSLTCGDVSVVTVQEGFEGTCVSSKLYSALASGQAVLVIAQDDADETRIVERYDAGLQVPQGDAKGVVAAIERWQSDPEFLAEQGRNAREAFEANFTKEQSIDEYYALLAGEGIQQVTNGSGTSS